MRDGFKSGVRSRFKNVVVSKSSKGLELKSGVRSGTGEGHGQWQNKRQKQ